MLKFGSANSSSFETTLPTSVATTLGLAHGSLCVIARTPSVLDAEAKWITEMCALPDRMCRGSAMTSLAASSGGSGGGRSRATASSSPSMIVGTAVRLPHTFTVTKASTTIARVIELSGDMPGGEKSWFALPLPPPTSTSLLARDATSIVLQCAQLANLQPSIRSQMLRQVASLYDGAAVCVGAVLRMPFGVEEEGEVEAEDGTANHWEATITRVTTAAAAAVSTTASSSAFPSQSSLARVRAATTKIAWDVDVQAQAAATAAAAAASSSSALSPRGAASPAALSPWKNAAPLGYSSPSSSKAPSAASSGYSTPRRDAENGGIAAAVGAASFSSPLSSPSLPRAATPPKGPANGGIAVAAAGATPLSVAKQGVLSSPDATATPLAAAVISPLESSLASAVAPSPSNPSSTSSTLAGLEKPLSLLREVVLLPLTQAPLLAQMHLTPPKGVLLHGPPGCGKTLLVRTVANEVASLLYPAPVKVFAVDGPEVLSPIVGESERRLRAVFAAAEEHASSAGIAIVFLDELDALCPKRATPGMGTTAASSSSSSASARLITQLLTLMDGLASGGGESGDGDDCSSSSSSGSSSSTPPPRPRVVVIGATNRPDALDLALRRPGRFDREVRIDPPKPDARLLILQHHSKGLPLAPETEASLPSLAELCVGYVGADLQALCREAASAAMRRQEGAAIAVSSTSSSSSSSSSSSNTASSSSPSVLPCDFEKALLKVGASALRGDGTNPDATSSAVSGGISWDRVGGMGDVVRRLREAAEYPLTRGESYKRFGLAPPRGILLYGPPGCSKTTLIRALAGAVSASFFSLSGAEVFSPWVGDAESCVRKVFARARGAAPSILFLDEVDAMVGSRGIGGSGHGGGSTSVGVLATLLTEMDGVAAAGGVLVVAATNRKESLDPALLRPGRLEVHILVPLPDAKGREEILAVHTAKATLAEDVDIASLASDANTSGWSGAALEGLAREAAMEALREDVGGARRVCGRHFEAALKTLKGGGPR